METLEESEVTAVYDPSLGAVQKSGEDYGPVDGDLYFSFQVLIVPYFFVESAKGAVCLRKSFVDFLVDPGVG